MIRKLAALISLAFVFSGSFAISAESAAAKASQSNASKARNFFVPPPPPYTPSIGPGVLSMKDLQTMTAGEADPSLEKFGNFYMKPIAKRDQSDTSQFVHTSSGVRFNPVIETKIQKHIDDFDSEISNSQKEIGKLLNL